MTSHYQPDHRGVYPIPAIRNLYDTLEERSRIAAVEVSVRRDLRVMRWQRIAEIAAWVAVVGYALKLAVIG